MGSKARRVRDLLRISPFSSEFERAEVAAQNPLKWMLEVDGLAVDVRHVPLDIQMAAFERGFIPYVPALGPDGTAAWQESWPMEAASGAPRSEPGGLLERCSELKRQMVELACSPRFSGQLGQALQEHATDPVASEADVTNVVDHFILQQPLADGRPGYFMTARIVPVGDDWMLSGAQGLYAPSDRPAMLRLAADLAPWLRSG
jgi:hypothetical protein